MTPIIQMPSTSQPNCQRSFSRKLVRLVNSQIESGSFWTTTSNRTGTNLCSWGNRRFYLIVGCCQPQLNLDFEKGQIKRGMIFHRSERRMSNPWLLPGSPSWWSKVYAVSVNAQGQFGLFWKKKANGLKPRIFSFQFINHNDSSKRILCFQLRVLRFNSASINNCFRVVGASFRTQSRWFNARFNLQLMVYSDSAPATLK